MRLNKKRQAQRQLLLDNVRRYVEEKQNLCTEEILCCSPFMDGAPQRTTVHHAGLKLTCQSRRPSIDPKLEDYLKQKDASFSETLASMIQQRGLKKSAVYKKAHLTKQHFSKLINDPEAKPTKATAVSLAIGLELDFEQTQQFIGKAGYVLSDSSVFDLIIRYFVEQRIYDVIEINFVLYAFDQPLLGA